MDPYIFINLCRGWRKGVNAFRRLTPQNPKKKPPSKKKKGFADETFFSFEGKKSFVEKIAPPRKMKGWLIMEVFAKINDLPEEEVLRRLNLSVARDGKSYVCPLCGNGAAGDPRHGHGDGIKPRNSKGRVRWKCHKCAKDFSNFDLAAATLGLDAERETAESARKVAELFGIPAEQSFSFFEGKKSARTAWTPELKEELRMDEKKSAPDKESKNYAKLYEYCRQNYSLDSFLAERGGTWRGLTLETLKKAGALYHGEYMFGEGVKLPAIILPYDEEHYFVRAIEGARRRQKGANAGLYEPTPISTKFPNFIVEGEPDALSIAQVLGALGAFGCVATGGASKYHKVVPLLEKRFGNAERKPSFIVMFDNDKTGKGNGLMLANELKASGYPAERFFLGENVDSNDLLQRGEEELMTRLFEAIEQTERQLAAQAESMKKSADRARQAAIDKSGMKISSFADYFAADFFSDIAQAAKYSERKTGFENIDAAQVFMPGLYVLGALPATGKTTFAWQLLNQLALNGEPCIYCSYEMSRAELFTKSIARELYKRYPEMSSRLDLSSVNIRRGACSDMKELQNLAATFAKSATNLRVAELSNTGIAELIEKLKPMIADASKSAVICLDYLQIVPSKDARPSSAKEKVDDAMLRLKDFQRETNSTLIVISSFNRENYFQPVSFSSFKESGAIEYSADVIWGLENHGVGANGEPDKGKMIEMSREKVRKIKFSCLKNRNGGQYECFFRYHAAHDFFEPFEKKKERPIHAR